MTSNAVLIKKVEPFIIKKGPSIFTNRNGLLDIVILKVNPSWGAVYDGKRYTIAMILEAETYRPIRSHLSVPKDLLDKLVEWGF